MRSTLDDGRIEFRAASLSRSTPGALRTPRSDESIQAELLALMARAPWLALDAVSVLVDRGEVFFDGEIPEPRLRTALYELAARCRGVRAVKDSLRIRRAPGAV